jgi:leucyl aminopeptidase
MKISFSHTSLKKLKTDLLIVPASAAPGRDKKQKTNRRSTANKKALPAFDAAVTAELKELRPGTFDLLCRQAERLNYRISAGKRLEIFMGEDAAVAYVRLSGLSSLGLDSPKSLNEWRKLGGDALSSAKRLGLRTIAISLANAPAGAVSEIVEALVEGLILADYDFRRYKSKSSNSGAAEREIHVEVLCRTSSAKVLEKAATRARIWAEACCFARDLVNTPPSDMNPGELLKQSRKISRIKQNQVQLKVFGKPALTRMKAFSLLGVARGSDVEPYLLHLRYRPRKRKKTSKVITLIGKGVTFDSGGLSIKTGKGMEDMKCDMAGAACVLSVMKAVLSLPLSEQPQHEIHVLVPTVENMINGKSLKPGDVISAMNGKTIEVLNTDAEGRLILADALSYAAGLKSDLIVDLATLTGACVVALGSDYAGMFSNDKDAENRLLEAADAAGENLWPLPLAGEYRPQLDSDVADIKNIGNGGPGAIIGALFLKDFVPVDTPWIHLDIAGPAFVTRANEYIKRGGTGFGVRSLLRFLDRL